MENTLEANPEPSRNPALHGKEGDHQPLLEIETQQLPALGKIGNVIGKKGDLEFLLGTSNFRKKSSLLASV